MTKRTHVPHILAALSLVVALLLGALVPCGSSALAAEATETEGVQMYRLYNPNSGEHFYTASAYERDSLVKEGWESEGVGWIAPAKSDTPVYRLYNPNAGDHHYTASAYERDSLVKAGWRYENVGWYSDDAEAVAVYRQYNPNAVSGAHNYTTSTYERDMLIKAGWNDEEIGWYGLSTSEDDPYHGLATRTPIMGASSVSADEMVAYFQAYLDRTGKEYPADVYAQYGAATLEDFCRILLEEANAEGVRAEVLFAQVVHETGYLQFGGQVKAEQCNFGGIGATDGGASGADFSNNGEDSVRIGLRAQAQHLKAYASTEPLEQECVDPRFNLVTRGSAPLVENLGSGKWASSPYYAEALTKIISALV